MITSDTRPRLAKKARLRYDERSSAWLLLYPERGLELSRSASDILRLCDGARTVEQIVGELASQYDGADAATLERDVLAFLRSMHERGLVESDP